MLTSAAATLAQAYARTVPLLRRAGSCLPRVVQISGCDPRRRPRIRPGGSVSISPNVPAPWRLCCAMCRIRDLSPPPRHPGLSDGVSTRVHLGCPVHPVRTRLVRAQLVHLTAMNAYGNPVSRSCESAALGASLPSRPSGPTLALAPRLTCLFVLWPRRSVSVPCPDRVEVG